MNEIEYLHEHWRTMGLEWEERRRRWQIEPMRFPGVWARQCCERLPPEAASFGEWRNVGTLGDFEAVAIAKQCMWKTLKDRGFGVSINDRIAELHTVTVLPKVERRDYVDPGTFAAESVLEALHKAVQALERASKPTENREDEADHTR